MNAVPHSLADAEERRLGPALLLPSTLSFFAAMLAWALAWGGERSLVALEVVTTLQAALMLSGAAVIAGAHSAAAGCWRRRVAPSAGLRRVRQASIRLLVHLAIRGAVGPLLMVASLAWLRLDSDVPALAAGVLVVLAGTLLVGATLGAGLQPRMAAWIAAAKRPAKAAWGRTGASRRWQRVLTRQEIAMAQRSGQVWIWFAIVPQSLVQAPHWRFHAWGHSLAGGADIGWAVLWMTVLGLFVPAAIVGPRLHWRARLAPGGLSATGWSRRMVAGSMLNACLWMSIVLGVSLAVSGAETRAAQLAAWLPVTGDALLAMAVALWMRGLGNSGWHQVLSGFILGAGTAVLLGAACLAGFAPQRGLALLLIELLLALGCAVAAQRAWSQQDLNRLAPHA